MSSVMGTVRNLPCNSALEFRNKANASDKTTTDVITASGGVFTTSLGDGKTYSIYLAATGAKCYSPTRITVDAPMAICVAAEADLVGAKAELEGELPGEDEY